MPRERRHIPRCKSCFGNINENAVNLYKPTLCGFCMGDVRYYNSYLQDWVNCTVCTRGLVPDLGQSVKCPGDNLAVRNGTTRRTHPDNRHPTIINGLMRRPSS